jgi:hypothetical protein
MSDLADLYSEIASRHSVGFAKAVMGMQIADAAKRMIVEVRLPVFMYVLGLA